MAGDWIKMRKKLLRDGRVLEVSRKCHVSRVTAIGALCVLWSLADEYAEEDGRFPGYTIEDLNREVEVSGFCEAMPAEWMVVKDGVIYLPEYQQHNGETGKQRAMAAKRKRKQRGVTQVSQKCHGQTVTREEKRREEYKNPPTPLRGEGPAEGEKPAAPVIHPTTGETIRPAPDDTPEGLAQQWCYHRQGAGKETLHAATEVFREILRRSHPAADVLAEILSGERDKTEWLNKFKDRWPAARSPPPKAVVAETVRKAAEARQAEETWRKQVEAEGNPLVGRRQCRPPTERTD